MSRVVNLEVCRVLEFLLPFEIKWTHQAGYVTLHVDTHAAVTLYCFVCIIPIYLELFMSDGAQRFFLSCFGRKLERVCLGKRPTESNAFRQRCVCVWEWAWVVAKPAELVGREQGCIKRRSTAQKLSVIHHPVWHLLGVSAWLRSGGAHWSVSGFFCHLRATERWGIRSCMNNTDFSQKEQLWKLGIHFFFFLSRKACNSIQVGTLTLHTCFTCSTTLLLTFPGTLITNRGQSQLYVTSLVVVYEANTYGGVCVCVF